MLDQIIVVERGIQRRSLRAMRDGAMSVGAASAGSATEPEPIRRVDLNASILHLHAADPVMARLIDHLGPCTLRPGSPYLESLVFAVTAQQISLRAALRIMARVHALVRPEPFTAAGILRVGFDALRAAGLTTAKARCIVALAEQIASGRIDLDHLALLDDEQVIVTLTQTKGIGLWTAEMFLIFALNRPNVLPVGDLVFRTAVMREYLLEVLPNRARIQEIAAAWAPYRTVATWYLWRSVENMEMSEENAGWWYSDSFLSLTK
jgi:DNA-3-methyladenine glycosylase II